MCDKLNLRHQQIPKYAKICSRGESVPAKLCLQVIQSYSKDYMKSECNEMKKMNSPCKTDCHTGLKYFSKIIKGWWIIRLVR